MKFACPKCRKVLTVKDEFAGRRGRCPACQAVIVAPQRPQDISENSLTPPEAASEPHVPHEPQPETPPPISQAPVEQLPEPRSDPAGLLRSEDSDGVPGELHSPGSDPVGSPDYRRSRVPPPLPPEIDPPLALPDTFFSKLIYCTEKERKELIGLMIGAAVIGAVAGFWWGGLYDPWSGDNKVFAAILNLLLFGGWGAAEVLGLLIARNFKLVARPGTLLAAGALCGGLWVGFWSAVDMATEPLEGLPASVNAIIGFLVGVLIGGGISAISCLKTSKTMVLPGRIIPHKPIRTGQRTSRQRASRQRATSSNGWKIALWIGAGVLVILIIGGTIVGTLVSRTMTMWREVEQELETERLIIEPVTPIPYPVTSMEQNLLPNGTFRDLEHWQRYDHTNAGDTAIVTTGDNYVVWTRTNSREESGALGVYQHNLDLDVRDAAQILLDLDVWVGGHTLIGTGEWTETIGITGEMPVHVEITYRDVDGEKFLWDRGFLVYGFSLTENFEYIEKATWTHFSFDLRDDTIRINPKGELLPVPATITKVMVYGNGWDFSGAVGNLCIQTPKSSAVVQE